MIDTRKVRPRVVIVGAGFGGLACAKRLAGSDVDVVLVDRHNYHLFTPLLYQVASSLLNASDIAHPVRAVLRGARNVEVRLADVTAIDLASRVVRLRPPRDADADDGIGADHAGATTADDTEADGDGGAELSWDFLVLAMGSETRWFGLESLREVAFDLKDLPKALALRNHVLGAFEAAATTVARDPSDNDARRAWLTFVVAGGGPTGVEYAGALHEFVPLAGRDFNELDPAEVRVVLAEAGKRLLPSFSPPSSDETLKALEKRGIEVRLGEAVEGYDGREVRLSGGGVIPARTLVWAAGVRPPDLVTDLATGTRNPDDPPAAGGPDLLTRSGRIAVDESLRIPGVPGAYAIGDVAAFVQDGKELPMLSAPAIQEGRHAARNILQEIRHRRPLPFSYLDKGIMATIGRNDAVAEIGPLRLRGFIGWVVWLTVHLYFLIGFRNRLSVFLGWAWNYIRYDRPIRIITRAREDPGPGP